MLRFALRCTLLALGAMAWQAQADSDCDGNGIPDVVDTEVAFQPHLVSAAAIGARSVVPADLDGDGDVDLVSASKTDSKVAWYPNTDGQGSYGAQQVIDLVSQSRAVFAADLDDDGDADVLSASLLSVGWYENVDGTGRFGPRQIIDPSAFVWETVHASDLDGDGDMDVLAGSVGGDAEYLRWYRNVDGAGTFAAVGDIQAFGIYSSVLAADLDADGDLDVLSAGGGACQWFENLDALGSFAGHWLSGGSHREVSAVDVNGDGDVDIASIRVAQVGIYENIQNAGFGPWQIVSTEVDDGSSAQGADLDGDGVVDIVSASLGDDKIAWYRNDGTGGFGAQQAIATLANGPRSIRAADLDADGDVDLVVAAEVGNRIVWFENLSDDCNGNRIPDSCEPDCNGNGVADGCDIRSGGARDCNADAIPDSCQSSCGACDVDDDGCLDATDAFPADGSACGDTDLDGCDDCSGGSFDPGHDGVNVDADPSCDAGDCDAADNEVWHAPGAASELVLSKAIGQSVLGWLAPDQPGAVQVRFDSLRSTTASDFVGPAVCLETDGADLQSIEGTTPGAGGAFFYLIRVENGCPLSPGNMGSGSDGAARIGVSCP